MNIKVQRFMSMLEWQTTTTDAEVTKGRLLHITKEQRTMKSQSSKIIKHEGTKTKDYSTTTHKVQRQRTRKT